MSLPTIHSTNLYSAAMHTLGVSIAVMLSAAGLPAFAQHGVITADINREGAACSDFFDYANGAWHRANPIPDYMDR